jgi:hypothetical protein
MTHPVHRLVPVRRPPGGAGHRGPLEYRGPSDVIDPKADEVYKTRIVYPSRTPADAPKNLPPPG